MISVHNIERKLFSFCEEETCQKPICSYCFTEQHMKHGVVNIEEKKKENLMKNIEEAKKGLTEKFTILTKVKEDIKDKTKATVNELEKTMAAINKKLGNMIKEAENKLKDANTRIDADATIINENIVLLEQIGKNVAAEIYVTLEDLNNGQETLAEVMNTAKVNICGSRTFNIKTFQANQEIDYGRLNEEMIKIVLPEITAFEEKTSTWQTNTKSD